MALVLYTEPSDGGAIDSPMMPKTATALMLDVRILLERLPIINDGGSLPLFQACIFSRQQSGNNSTATPAQKERVDLAGDVTTRSAKAGQHSCCRASSSRFCAAVFGAIDVRSMGRSTPL